MVSGEFEKYNQYTASDFLDDDDFIRHVKYALQDDEPFWKEWLDGKPLSEPAYRQAAETLRIILGAKRIELDEAFEEELWKLIDSNVQRADKQKSRGLLVRFSAIAAAACVLGLVLFAWYYTSQVTISTKYGEHADVVLPDNSSVTLNANSSLTYYRTWMFGRKREVWLNGEGYFKVKHFNADTSKIKAGERFVAHAGDVSVEVLGTVFNIKQRSKGVEVSLMEGRIRVTDNKGKIKEPVVLQPGNVLDYEDSVAVSAIRQLTNSPQAWLEHRIEAKDMTVQDVIDNYEQTFGYHIILEKPELAAKRIDGTISLKSEKDLLYMLANILNANIERQGNNIYLRPK